MTQLLDVKSNFDWAETRGKKLVIFCPNYKYSKLTEYSIENIKTKVDPSEWLIIIGNDNIDNNWNHLRNKNVRYFTLLHDHDGPRNGAFIRNYCIRRCQSDKLLQKDGEVIITGDFIYRAIYFRAGWRAGRVFVLPESVTKTMYESTGGIGWVLDNIPPTKIIEPMVADNAYHAKEIIALADGQVNPSTYFHYAYACFTRTIQEMGGYDERFRYYGFEDSDIFCRLYHLSIQLCPDYGCAAIHPWHPRATDCTPERLQEMRNVFIADSPGNYIRNTMREWGTGI